MLGMTKPNSNSPLLSQDVFAEGEVTFLLCLIQLKFEPPDSQLLQRIPTSDNDTLLRWSERILTASTMDEFPTAFAWKKG